MGFLSHLKDKFSDRHGENADELPPQWAPAPEKSYDDGKLADATDDEYKTAEAFCIQFPPQPPRPLPSAAVDRIKEVGAKAWEIEYPQTPRFVGSITNPSETKGGPSVCTVETNAKCQDVCLMSNLPLMAGMYDGRGKKGFYYEILIKRMDGLIAIGEPYPVWRLPGWNRLSAGLHLDDLRKFFEDPDGGRDYTEALTQVSSGDTVGCGYEFTSGALFFTYNGQRLANAFTGIYLPRHNHDVFAAIGVEGRNDFEVNFGAELFRWKEGNEWAWLTEGSVGGQMSGGPSDAGDELPSYNDANSSTAFT